MEIAAGYLTPYFVTDPRKLEAELDDGYVLIVAGRLTSAIDLMPLLEEVLKASRPLLVVAEDVVGEALATLVVSKVRGTLPCCAIKAPGVGAQRAAALKDLATLTSGRVVGDHEIDTATLSDLGRAGKVVVSALRTQIIDGAALN
jgi:chaperonin GroEL